MGTKLEPSLCEQRASGTLLTSCEMPHLLPHSVQGKRALLAFLEKSVEMLNRRSPDIRLKRAAQLKQPVCIDGATGRLYVPPVRCHTYCRTL